MQSLAFSGNLKSCVWLEKKRKQNNQTYIYFFAFKHCNVHIFYMFSHLLNVKSIRNFYLRFLNIIVLWITNITITYFITNIVFVVVNDVWVSKLTFVFFVQRRTWNRRIEGYYDIRSCFGQRRWRLRSRRWRWFTLKRCKDEKSREKKNRMKSEIFWRLFEKKRIGHFYAEKRVEKLSDFRLKIVMTLTK